MWLFCCASISLSVAAVYYWHIKLELQTLASYTVQLIEFNPHLPVSQNKTILVAMVQNNVLMFVF